MLILESVQVPTEIPAIAAFEAMTRAYASSPPDLQRATFAHVATNGDGASAFTKQQVIAGALGLVVGLVIGRSLLGGR